MRKITSTLAALALILVGLVATTAPAEAASYGRYTVASWSTTCLTMWDHIDGYGRPYGTRAVRCPGQSFPTYIDWDYVAWAYPKCLTWAGRNPIFYATGKDCVSGAKFATYSVITFGTH